MKLTYEIPNKPEFAVMNMKDRANQILCWINENSGSEIDFNSCFHALRWNALKNDFNIFPEEVNTEQEYYDLDEKIAEAYNNRAPLIRRNCRDCGESFVIFLSERDYYLKQKLMLPKRCKHCRDAKANKIVV